MSKKKTFEDYEKQQKAAYLKKIGGKRWSKKREAEFYALPKFGGLKKGTKEYDKQYERLLRYNNRERARKRYQKNGGFVLTESYERNTGYLSKASTYFENEAIFGDNVREIQALFNQRPDLKTVEVYDATGSGENFPMIGIARSIKEAVRKIKSYYKDTSNYFVSVATKDGSLIIKVNNFY